MDNESGGGITRREAMLATGTIAAGAALASSPVPANAQSSGGSSRAVSKEVDGKMTTTISLDWNEVYYTNCPLISASNVDQELGWTGEEYDQWLQAKKAEIAEDLDLAVLDKS